MEASASGQLVRAPASIATAGDGVAFGNAVVAIVLVGPQTGFAVARKHPIWLGDQW
jgi:hypothetical protein